MAVGIPGATPFGGHAGPVLCVAFSPDGRTLVTGGLDGTVRLWDTATKAQTRQLTGHAGGVLAVAWSPDGASIVSCGDTIVRLWDAASGLPAGQLTGHSHPVTAVAWSPDSSTVASGAGTLRLWDASSRRQVGQFSEHNHPVNAVAWSPDGAAIASGAASVRVWDPATGRQVRQLTGHSHPVRSVAWHPDGTALATGAGTICLWEPDSSTLIRRFADLGEELRHVIAWKPDGSTIATIGGVGGVGGETAIELWDAATGELAGQFPGRAAEVRALAWIADGTIIATANGDDCTMELWDTVTGQPAARLAGHTGEVSRVAWNRDGSAIATIGTSDHLVRIWNAATGEQTGQLAGIDGIAQAVTWHPDGTIVIADDGGAVRRWNVTTGDESLVTRFDSAVNDVAWNLAGTALAIAPTDGTARLWDPVSEQETGRLSGHDLAVVVLTWRPDGTAVAGIDYRGGFRVWDAGSGEQIGGLGQSGYAILALAWSPDGTAVATASSVGAIRLWDPVTRQQIRLPPGPYQIVRRITWSPDSTALAMVGQDDSIRIWDPAAGQETRRIAGHTGQANDVAWSPDGNTIASTGADGNIRFWNPRSGMQVNGTGFGKARVPDRPLAGVRSDSPSATDLLGMSEDVAMLAELIAATETRPPLAVALIGDWGAGKSSVMLQMEKHVGELAKRARNNPGLTAWAETVRQVRFNAWHYSDEQLWAGLVSHLFDVLAAPADEAEDESSVDPRSVADKRADLKAERDDNRRASELLDGRLKAADEISQPAESLSWLRFPRYAARILPTVVWQGFRDVRASLLTVLGWLVLGLGAWAAWHYLQSWIALVAAAAAFVLPPVTTALARTRGFVEQQRANLAARQLEYQRKIKSLDDQLVLIDAAERLARFLTEHGGGSAYRQYQGLLGQVRVDLDQLAADLGGARRQWERGGRVGSPPLERIVLYIDDLDRCPPRRVVEVLEAVHLMLALDLFVVVVAVDARWLIRSLEYHHRELFQGNEDNENLATPIDYLDKIFQIPFTLLAPAPAATADYLRSLLPQPAPAQRTLGGRDGTAGPGVAEAVGDRDSPRAGGDNVVAGAAGRVREPATRAEDGPSNARLPELDQRGRGEAEAAASRRVGPALEFAEAVVVELRPLGLQVSAAEIEFMARLGELLPTPRVAKRLVNLYRLVRIGVRGEELADFVGDEASGPYQAVQVLLAILVGHPEFAREVFRVILDSDGAGTGESDYADLVAVVERAAGSGGRPHSFPVIHAFLGKIREEAPAAVSMAECRRWCPQLARFSFYTREMAGDASRR
jgi:WD40 repeat protein